MNKYIEMNEKQMKKETYNLYMNVFFINMPSVFC